MGVNGTSGTLPRFNKPPVVEVVLGVQFTQLQAMNIAHIGLLWERYRDRFPKFNQQPALPHAIERLGSAAQQGGVQSFSFDFGGDRLQRAWLANADNTELIQIQNDRFIRNWRRYHDSTIPYPSYERLKPRFLEDWALFSAFVEESGLGGLIADQCEIAYVSHIEACDIWRSFGQVNRVFRGWSENYPALTGSPADAIGFKARHEVMGPDGAFVGRLFVELDSAYVAAPANPGETRPIFQLQLTVRGSPLSSGIAGVTGFLDLGHELIVNSFVKLTTPEMHQVWERTA